MSLTIVVPVFRDDAELDDLLHRFAALAGQQLPERTTLVVVDGASDTQTAQRVAHHGQTYMASLPGRGQQIARGISTYPADWYWIVHADTQLEHSQLRWLQSLMAQGSPAWGRFDIQLHDLPWLAWFMNWRSRLTRICTGDQAMFVHQTLLDRIGGFPPQPLMEDIECSRRLKREAASNFVASQVRVGTSTRRWRSQGIVRTVLSMWLLRLRYWWGSSAEDLYQAYYGRSSK